MKKLEFYEMLGARKFQKFVFKVERLKYMLLRPWSNQIIKFVHWRIDRKLKKTLKNRNKEISNNIFINKIDNIKSSIINFSFKKKDNSKKKLTKRQRLVSLKEYSEEDLIHYFNREKLRVKIEFNNEENRNYHFKMFDVQETLMYLNINKKIHNMGLKSNLFYILLISGGIFLFDFIFPILIVFLSYQSISLFVNFQCINLQNYNILRLESRLERLESIRKRKMVKKIEMYDSVSKVIAPLLSKQKELPLKEDIVSSLSTSQEFAQMRMFLDEVISRKESRERKLKL